MNEHPILGQLVLGYSPMIDRQRKVTATHLTVFPQRPDLVPEAAPLLAALATAWPEGGEALLLNVASEPLLRELLSAELPAHLGMEVPAFLAADATLQPLLTAAQARGTALYIRGRPSAELPKAVLAGFRQAIIDVVEERRQGPLAEGGASRTLGFVQAGVRCASDVEAAFGRGAHFVLGWPIEESVARGNGKSAAPNLKVIVELINRVDREESIDRLEAVLKNDPTLAFRLVRYINSAAFGLRVEISSFRHAIMMLGYQKLKRWLALLLASASNDANMRPVMHAAVRRGLIMEELVRGAGDEQMGSEMFICGVFSLLDIMMGQPFDQLLKSIPVPQDVFEALVNSGGRYAPYLELVRAIEQASPFDIRERAETVMLSASEINHALLRAMGAARQLE